jgi:hypothetical protein
MTCLHVYLNYFRSVCAVIHFAQTRMWSYKMQQQGGRAEREREKLHLHIHFGACQTVLEIEETKR